MTMLAETSAVDRGDELILDRVESTLALATCTIGLDTRYAPPFTHSLDQSVHHIRRTRSLDARKSVTQHVDCGG